MFLFVICFLIIIISVHKNMDNYEKIALVLVVFFSPHEKIVAPRKSSKTAFDFANLCEFMRAWKKYWWARKIGSGMSDFRSI